jgi:hypothetical protein
MHSSGEEVSVTVPGVVSVRGTYVAEGLYDASAGGDPDVEELYEFEVAGARGPHWEPLTFPRLLPGAPPAWEAGEAGALQPSAAERYALALAWSLSQSSPAVWPELCEASRGWDAWMVEELLDRIPASWTPVPLCPEEE